MKPTKKEQIEITAKELFWKHGFRKVSIDEICKKSNVSRKTYYTFYENKNALVIYLYNKLIDETYIIYEGIVESDLSFPEKLEKLFNYKFEFTKNISMEFISDFYNPEAGELTTLFNKTIDRSIKFMRDFLSIAQKNGDINQDLSLDYIMFMMQKAIDLCGTKELMSMFPDAASLTKQVTQSIVYGIMPVKNNF
ncbi:MAG: TetR/AcrR family transcriptional regulator [Paludibacter sp.]|nr:TetR/AcrR family transcriptional regulator [Paludibacter sp.]